MEIARNTTGMSAGVSAQVDRDGHQWCVVVVKGTFATDSQGTLRLCDRQRPLIEVDEHYGEPGATALRYENDYALEKPLTDVVVVGKAIAPGGRPAPEVRVALEVNGAVKEAVVVGDRRWVYMPGGSLSSPPVPFTEMPLNFERSFGGVDAPRGPGSEQAELRNPIGTGFIAAPRGSRIDGVALPNLERPRARVRTPATCPEPIGFWHVGRSWQPRLSYAGTYDAAWLKTRRPFLPLDFDLRFFQSAPEDQQFARFRGGEHIRCHGMAERPVVDYLIPQLRVFARAVYADRTEGLQLSLDTVVLEPHEDLAMLSWRTKLRMPRRAGELRCIWVGSPPSGEPSDYRDGRPVFARLGDATKWLARQRRPDDEEGEP